MTVIGITGPTGAGKTTVLNVLRDMGGAVADCDAVYHGLLRASAPLREELRARFGGEIFDGAGGLRRKALGAIVFGDAGALADLDAITHRHIIEEVERRAAQARAEGRRIIVLAGRPYHIDPEIGHGIDKLASSLGFVVVSEDSVCHLADPAPVHVLNQWTYHARLYRAARYACAHPDVQLVQLVSFGCGVDAITTDEVRRILEEEGRLYTQIKIDEITNLGAVKIRLRSLIGALEEKEGV